MKKPGLAKNFAFLSVGEALSKVFTFISFTYLGRNFGPAVYGEVEFSLSVTLVFALFLQMGLGSYGAREVARRPDDARKLLREIVEVRTVMSLIAVAC
ncbi:MAG: oligosaccharide flippase family protein, partial [Acidobacteriota bacterium]